MGLGRRSLRHARHVVPAGRRHLHGLHLHRRPRACLRQRRARLLRRALYDHRLSLRFRGVSAAVVGGEAPRLHHRGRFRARALRQQMAGARRGAHRHRRDDALYRPPTRGHPGGDRRHGHRIDRLVRRPAAGHRFRRPRGLHLHQRLTRAGGDRHRQGFDDLHHGCGGGHRRPAPARRLRQDLRRGAAGKADPAAAAGDIPQYKPYFAQYKANFAVPALLLNQFPAWFVGFAFAAIGIGALVPAAIMSIAASNLWTRNIYKEFISPNCTPKQEAQMAKWVSLIVKFGALVFVLGFSSQYAIYLQLLGGVWIIQTLPAVVLGLYTRWLNQWALLIGWAAGIVTGTWMAASVNFAAAYPLHIGGLTAPGYIAVWTLILNLVVTVVLTAIFNALGAAKPRDETAAADYV